MIDRGNDDSAFDPLHDDNAYDEKEIPDLHLLNRPSTPLLPRPRLQTPPPTPQPTSEDLEDLQGKFASLTPPSVVRQLRRLPLPLLLPPPSLNIPPDLCQSRVMPPYPNPASQRLGSIILRDPFGEASVVRAGQFLSPMQLNNSRESQRVLDTFQFSPHLLPLDTDQYNQVLPLVFSVGQNSQGEPQRVEPHQFPPRSPVTRQPPRPDPRENPLPPLFSPSVLSVTTDDHQTFEEGNEEPDPSVAQADDEDDESYKENSTVGSTPPRVRCSPRRTPKRKVAARAKKTKAKKRSSPRRRSTKEMVLARDPTLPRGPTLEELASAPNKRTLQGMESWWRRFYELCAFRQTHGHTNVPQTYKPNRQLGIWVNKQRMERKFRDEQKTSSMTQIRLEALDALGFAWAKRKGEIAWRMRFEQLVEYKNQYGHCQVPTKYVANRPLGRWVSTQRSLYKQNQLSDPHFQELQSIGFSFDALNKPTAEQDAENHAELLEEQDLEQAALQIV